MRPAVRLPAAGCAERPSIRRSYLPDGIAFNRFGHDRNGCCPANQLLFKLAKVIVTAEIDANVGDNVAETPGGSRSAVEPFDRKQLFSIGNHAPVIGRTRIVGVASCRQRNMRVLWPKESLQYQRGNFHTKPDIGFGQ
jgi:hypothetical protein